MLSTIGRIIWVAIAFVISAAIGLAVLFLIGAERLAEAVHRQGGGVEGDVGRWIGFGEQALGLFEMLTLLSIAPALLVVLVGEVARLRSMLYWVPAGGAAMAVLPFLSKFSVAAGLPADFALPPTTLLQVLATSGFAAGLVYWLIAGRLVKD
jgi:hypothetical protein